MKRRIDPNKVWAFIGKVSAIVIAQTTFAQLSLFILNNCITVYR